MKTSEVLTKAADLLEKEGWIQGKFTKYAIDPLSGNEECLGRCAVGAIYDITCVHPLREKAKAALKQRIYYSDIPHWNDNTTRTKEEVISTFREVANVCISQGD